MTASTNRSLKHSKFLPYDPYCSTYTQSEGGDLNSSSVGGFIPYEYPEGYYAQGRSWHDGCFISAGLNPMPNCTIKGPDTWKFLEYASVNTFKKLTVGRSRHVMFCNEDGQLIQNGMILKVAEDEANATGLWPYPEYAASLTDFDVTVTNTSGEEFFYQLGGPTSLQIIEAASGEDLHDVKFLDFKWTKIAGVDVYVLRIGMCGSLAYEVHGVDVDKATTVYAALLEAGKNFGLMRLGRRAYRTVHTEGGFVQVGYHFPLASQGNMLEWIANQGVDMAPPTFSGSYEGDFTSQLRDPVELGWGATINWGHDFIGKDALKKIYDNPTRTIVTLEWDPEDVLDVYRAQFVDTDKACTHMEWTHDSEEYYGGSAYHADGVLDADGKVVGISSGRMFSPHYSKMLSMATIDVEFGDIGSEVFVLWGDPGTKQKKIKARVERWPYNDKDRNETFDVSVIPRLAK